MSSGLDWERFGVITGGDEVCILPPPTMSEKGWVYPPLSISPQKMCGPYIYRNVLSDAQKKWDEKNIRRTALSVLVRILCNIM